MKPAMNVVTEPSTNSTGDPAVETPRPGQVIGDRYRLEQPLERGAMGSVWRAEHVRLKAPIAVKFLEPALINDTEMRDRFIQEARSAAAVRSAHIVQVLDYGAEGGVPYIAMELLEGENLETRLNRRGRLTPDELRKMFSEVARGIGKAHTMGVVHRDLKPGNIFLAREGEHEITKLVDFGIAKVKADALNLSQIIGTQLGTLLGTPQYMSPEQMRGSAAVDYRTDLWALAIIACECLTGRYPFSGTNIGDLTVQICTEKPLAPSSLGPVPAGFDQWFFKATRKAPSKRFESAEQMARALSRLLAAGESSIPLVRASHGKAGAATLKLMYGTPGTLLGQLGALAGVMQRFARWSANQVSSGVTHLRWKALSLGEAIPESWKLSLWRPASIAALGLVLLSAAVVAKLMSSSSSRAATSDDDPGEGVMTARASDTTPELRATPPKEVVFAALPAEPEPTTDSALAERAGTDRMLAGTAGVDPNVPAPEAPGATVSDASRSAQPSSAQPSSAQPSSAQPSPAQPSPAKSGAVPERRRPRPLKATAKAAPADPIAEAAARILKTPVEPPREAEADSMRSDRTLPPTPKYGPRTTKPSGERHPFDDRL